MAPHLPPGTHLVNAAGLLTGPKATFRGLHRVSPAPPAGCQCGLAERQPRRLISTVAVDAATPFAQRRRQTRAAFAAHTILRPSLVLADTSYGGSSLLRALAPLPFVLPVVGSGTQCFNPVHAADLAEVVMGCLTIPPLPGIWQVGGMEKVTQTLLIQACRDWLGLRVAGVLRLPLKIARGLGGSRMRCGWGRFRPRL